MTQHSKFSPSSFGRLMKCAAAWEMSQLYKEQGASPAAREGTAAHWVAERTLHGQPLTVGQPIEGMPDLVVTQDMIDGAMMYREYAAQYAWHDIHIERKLTIPAIHPDVFGTPDLFAMSGDVLHVFDYKFGHGFVDEFENWQLLAYASGAISELDAAPASVMMHIIQPRAFSSRGTCRSWQIGINLFTAYERQLSEMVRDIVNGDRTARAGDHCKYCVGRHACATLQKETAQVMDIVEQNTVMDLPPNALGVELSMLHRASKLLEYRISGLEEQAKHLMQQGQRVANYSLKSTNGRSKWACNDAEVLAFGQLFGLDLRKPDPITPTQAAKQLPIAMPDNMVFTPTSITLVEDDINESRRIFS